MYKMPKYIDISTRNIPPITYIPSNNTTTIKGNALVTEDAIVSGNAIVSGKTTLYGLANVYGNIDATNVILNDYKLQLRNVTDTNNFIQYHATPNGPSIQGYAGGRIGTTAGVPNVIGWDTTSATINGNLNVTGTSVFTNLPTSTATPTTGTQLTTKTYVDSVSGVTLAGANTFTGTNIFNKIYETIIATTGTTSPFTCNMALGSTFYIPTDYTFASNFQIIITNVPTDTTKSYTISVIYRQPTTLFYSSTARVSDTASTYLLGTVSTFVAPLFNGGLPVLSNTPNLVIQSFSIISTATSASTFTRYVTSSVNNHY